MGTYSEISKNTYAAGHLVKYPPDYPIIVAVASNNRGQNDVTCNKISTDVIQPLLPPSAPQLANNPKIFLINAYSLLNVDASRLTLPSEGNFIVSLINEWFSRDFNDCFRYLIQALEDSSESIEEVLMRLKCEIKMMTILSHLNEPFYLNPHTHDTGLSVVG